MAHYDFTCRLYVDSGNLVWKKAKIDDVLDTFLKGSKIVI